MNITQPEKLACKNWLDKFFLSYYKHRPVNATFIGIHEYDHKLPDFSKNSIADTVSEMQNLLQASKQIDKSSLSSIEKIDLKLAKGFLKTQIWEYQSKHFHRGNLSLYTGETAFGIMSLFLTEFASIKESLESAIERMNAIPVLLAQAQKNVTQAPLAWTQKAIKECEGSLAFLIDGIDYLINDYKINNSKFKTAAEKARDAFLKFQIYLKSEQRQKPLEFYSCGEEALDMYLRYGHFLNHDANEITKYAEEQMVETKEYLKEHVSDFNITSTAEVLNKLSNIHPTTENYYDRYQELWDEVRKTAELNDLLTWPDFPIRYVPRPKWTQKAAPYLYFLFYRSPAAFNRPEVHNYLVTPINQTMPISEQQKLLQANNDSVIKLNHVIHHGSIGHHVQNWHAFRSESRIGQMAAVDCASRIAMFCGGTMAEGWACYATDLMNEVGFLTPLEQYAEFQSRVRMCARAIVDVKLHHGEFSLEQAATFYEEHAGMNQNAAYGEAVKNSMFPGAAVMYLMGNDEIHKLRKEMTAFQGNDFSLQNFHDQFLSYGSIPVTLISADMKAKAKNDKQ